ncbi:Eco57I restriction-modification methylase domain-containing protein, partial [candidate division KSB1 bacterium]|nr:Eco57I restriction-modification methylase domain-containing protein [candidate division KSB1 bacterium]
RDVPLPEVDAVIGNPPYVRQEHVPKRKELKRQKGETEEAYKARRKTSKEFLQELCINLWPGLKLSGRSDLHCYFWPVAADLLTESGYFGFLTSSGWLDVEYGFALQGWILKNFKLIAVIESLDEPWFSDARVKTAATVLQRCNDQKRRMENMVKFVRFLKPVKEILGERPYDDEAARQAAAESLRRLILQTKTPFSNDQLRIIPVPQSELWNEGVRAGKLLKQAFLVASESEEDEEDDGSEIEDATATYRIGADYAAGKWGRFLRAPDLYFKLLRDYRNRFVRLGEIAEVRFGIKSGCDAFFMPRDVTNEMLTDIKQGLPWNDVGLMTSCTRSEIQSGKVRIVRAGDNTLHPIETEYLRPEVHSLMQVERPVIRATDLDRVVLWVNKPLSELADTHVARYIRWGSKQTFPSKKSKAVPVPQRSTCASRPLWYDLTTDKIGAAFWPKSQQYRHIIPANPEALVCNCNLYTLVPDLANQHESVALAAILNSTIVGLFKCFYGRYAGTEGNLKTEVVDTVLLEIPDPRGVSPQLAERLSKALQRMIQREVTHLVDEAMLQCHSEEAMREILRRPPELPSELCHEDRRELDDCVIDLIGVSDKKQRQELLDELYRGTTEYYRYVRTQEIQAMVNRSGKKGRRLGPQDLAESIWNSLAETEKSPPIIEWIKSFCSGTEVVEIPEGKPEALGAADMFNPTSVNFKGSKENHLIS